MIKVLYILVPIILTIVIVNIIEFIIVRLQNKKDYDS